MDTSDSDNMPRPNYQAQKSGGVAYCPGYTDADGNWNNGFPCKRWGGPDDNYCCGDDNRRFCCPERNSAASVAVVAGNNDSPLKAELTRTTPKSRSISRSDQADAPGWPINSDLQGQQVTPSFMPQDNDGGLFQTLGRISGNVNFPLVPAIVVFSLTTLLLMSTVVLVCCCFCPSCPGGRSRRKRREAKASKFVKTTSVNLEAEETAAAIAAQALVSVAGFERHNFQDGAQILSCYSNTSVGKGQALLSGSSSATSSLPRGCVDFNCRSRQDNLSDQSSSIVPGCFQHKNSGAPILRGHQLKPHHLSEQLVESPSSSLQALVVQGQFMRNSPTTTSTSNSSEGANTGHTHSQSNYPNLGPALHYHCELRPSIEPHLMNVENLVSALYQNNQQIGAEMGWKTDVESGLMNMSSLAKELNGNVLNAFPPDPSLTSGMDDNSIKKWLSNTSQQLTPKRTLFNGSKCSYHFDVNGEAAERLLGDQAYHQLTHDSQNKSLFGCSTTYPDVTQTCISAPPEKQPFLENHDTDPSGKFNHKPDITSSFDETMLSAIDIPNCPQLKLTSGEWRLQKLRYESNIHAIP